MSLAHFTLILSLHYRVKCKSLSLAVYNNAFILCSVGIILKITDITKSLKICSMFKIDNIYFNIVRRRTEMTH